MKIAFLALFLLGCGRVERVYTWTREEPAAGRLSPATFEVRVRVDDKKQTVQWFERVYDRDGFIGTNIETREQCEIFDEQNWKCGGPPNLPGLLPDLTIQMTNGELRQQYWDEDRKYRSQYKVRF
jgi:hypothetical protein